MADNLPAPYPGSLRDFLRTEQVKARFSEVLNDRAPQFIASLATLVYRNPGLQDCDRNSVIASAMVAAALDLPIDPNLGFAYIIPFRDKRQGGKKIAQFQMGWKGYVQLALRTGQYAKLELNKVYKGEIRGTNRFTGDITFGERSGDEVTGYLLYFELVNGFRKYVYMTVEEAQAHGERYSPTFKNADSKWKTQPHDMGLKTVVKQGISKWGVMSIQFRNAVSYETQQAETEAQQQQISGQDYADPAFVAGQMEAEHAQQVKDDSAAVFGTA